MKLKEHIENFEKSLLKAVTGTGAAGTYTGRGGNLIDDLFSGGFHPISGSLKRLLKKQVEHNIAIRMWVDDITPIADQDFIDLDWKYEYDEYVEKDNSKFKTTIET